MRWQSPRPTTEEFELLYQGVYHGSAADVPGWLSDYPAPPPAVRRADPAIAPYVEAQHDHYLELLAQHHPNRGRLIEVGCSDGDFLFKAAADGWDVLGIEPSLSAAQNARSRGLEVRSGTYQQHLRATDQPDAIFLGHVFEHLDEPAAAADAFYEVLPSGGVLCLEVPNQFESWVDRAARMLRWVGRARESSILSIHHVNFFGPSHLLATLDEAGFATSVTSWSPPFGNPLVRGVDSLATRTLRQGRNLQAVAVKP